MIDQPGFYSLAPDVYHADPCPEPSLSGSVAVSLVTRSPRHAWWAHPRLNPQATADHSARLDLGTVAHRLLLGIGAEIRVIDANAYTTKAARDQRDEARAAGHVPVLADAYETAVAMASTASDVLAGHGFDLSQGTAEQTMIWREPSGIWCRGMMDWLHRDHRVVLDYKTTSSSAMPQDAERSLYSLNYHLKAAFYERGLDVLSPAGMGRRTFMFLFQETAAPYECSMLRLSEAGLYIGRKQATFAIEQWSICSRTRQWPGYAAAIHTATPPAWIESQWLARELADPNVSGLTAPGGRVEPTTQKPMGEWTP